MRDMNSEHVSVLQTWKKAYIKSNGKFNRNEWKSNNKNMKKFN